MATSPTPIAQRLAGYMAWLEREMDRLERVKAHEVQEQEACLRERLELQARKASLTDDVAMLSDAALIFERIRYCSRLDHKIFQSEIQEMEISARIRQVEGEIRQFATRKKIMERWLTRQNAKYRHREALREERRHQELAVLPHLSTGHWTVAKGEGP